MANNKKLENETQQWGDKLRSLTEQLAALQGELQSKKSSIATEILDGGDQDKLSAELGALEKKVEITQGVVDAARVRYEAKQVELAEAQKADAIVRQVALKDQSLALELEFLKAYEAVWKAALKLSKMAAQESADFGKFGLLPMINGQYYANEAVKIEALSQFLNQFNGPLLAKTDLLPSKHGKVKAELLG